MIRTKALAVTLAVTMATVLAATALATSDRTAPAAVAASVRADAAVWAAPAVAGATSVAETPTAGQCTASDASPVDAVKPCKGACPNKPYCTCTYQGSPRASCEPCCYYTFGGYICLD